MGRSRVSGCHPSVSCLSGWAVEGLGIFPLNPSPRQCSDPSRSLDSLAWPPWLPSAPGKGGNAPAASGPPACPREALEVQNKINSFNSSNFPQSRSAGSRPVLCGLQWAPVSALGCLCLMTVSQSHVSGVFLCPQAALERHHIENQNHLQWLQWSCSWCKSSLPGYQQSGIPGDLAAESTPSTSLGLLSIPPRLLLSKAPLNRNWTYIQKIQKMPTIPCSNNN